MPLLGRPVIRAAQSRIWRAWPFTARAGSLPWTMNAQSYNSGTAHNGDFRRSRNTVVTCGDLGKSALVSVRYLLTCP